MKIAYISLDQGIPVFGNKGASIHISATIHELLAAGHEIHLITPRPGGVGPSGVALHPLSAVTSSTTVDREWEAISADTDVTRILDNILPDMIYERYSLWGRSGMLWAHTHGVPSVLEVNAPLILEQIQHRDLCLIDFAEETARTAFLAADSVSCVSAEVAAWVRHITGSRARIQVVPNGVDGNRITPSPRPITPAGSAEFTVGFLGSLKPWHGVEVLLDALQTLVARDPSWRGLVVGDGPMASQLVDRVAGTSAEPVIEFTGAVAPDSVPDQLHRMDVAVAPYPSGASYFSPLKIFEYLAAGLPIVASRVGQIPAILGDGEFGELVAPSDPMLLATCLDSLRQNDSRRGWLRVAGRELVMRDHTWTKVVQKTLEPLGLGASTWAP